MCIALATRPCRCYCFFFFQAEDGIRDYKVTGVQTCALPISVRPLRRALGELRRLRAVHVLDFVREDALGRDLAAVGVLDRKSVVVGKECRSRWSPYH